MNINTYKIAKYNLLTLSLYLSVSRQKLQFIQEQKV